MDEVAPGRYPLRACQPIYSAEPVLTRHASRSSAVRLLLMPAVAMAFACERPPEVVYLRGETMGTTYNITVAHLPRDFQRDSLQIVIDEVLASVDRHLSTYNPASEISRFNEHADSSWFEVSPTLHEVLLAAQEVSARTGGAFDISVGPLVQLWGFGEGAGPEWVAPEAETLAAALAVAGYEKLELRDEPAAARKLQPALRVDVSAIAPGYAVDVIAQRFRALGATDYLVEIGGELLAAGKSPAGRPWRVAIEAPLAGERRPHAIVELNSLGVSTSGDYRDFRQLEERTISHTVDPRTGRPVEHQLTSVTVVHDSAMLSDAYATALMVLGPREGLAMAQRLNLAALLIARDERTGRLIESSTAEFEQLRRPLP